MRQKLDISMTTEQVAALMIENSAEAAYILSQLALVSANGLMFILDLDDMQMRGVQIVAAFKHCKENIPALAKAISNRDRTMINAVNQQTKALGLRAYSSFVEASASEANNKRTLHSKAPFNSSFSRGARVRRR